MAMGHGHARYVWPWGTVTLCKCGHGARSRYVRVAMGHAHARYVWPWGTVTLGTCGHGHAMYVWSWGTVTKRLFHREARTLMVPISTKHAHSWHLSPRCTYITQYTCADAARTRKIPAPWIFSGKILYLCLIKETDTALDALTAVHDLCVWAGRQCTSSKIER